MSSPERLPRRFGVSVLLELPAAGRSGHSTKGRALTISEYRPCVRYLSEQTTFTNASSFAQAVLPVCQCWWHIYSRYQYSACIVSSFRSQRLNHTHRFPTNERGALVACSSASDGPAGLPRHRQSWSLVVLEEGRRWQARALSRTHSGLW